MELMPTPKGYDFNDDSANQTSPTNSRGPGDTPASEATAEFIEFWVYHDGDLVPATGDELEWIRMREREREARWRLKQWSQREQMKQRVARRRLVDLAGLLHLIGRKLAPADANSARGGATAPDRHPSSPSNR